MKHLINNLAWILPVVVLVAVFVYTTWWRERPQLEGRITGDFAAAEALAADIEAPLFLAVDAPPH